MVELGNLISRLKDSSSYLPNVTSKTVSLDINALEKRLQERNKELKSFTLIPGPAGKDGRDGKIGPRGASGRDGRDGESIKGEKGDPGPSGAHGKGIKGDAGPAGPAGVGTQGKDGISIVDTWIAADNHLVVKLSNGKEIDAGNIETNVQHILSTQVASSNLENGISLPIRNVTGTYSVIPSDYTLYVTSGTFTITLPDAIVNLGKVYNIKNKGTGITTVATTSSQTIDGSTSITVSNDTNVQIQSNGTGWLII